MSSQSKYGFGPYRLDVDQGLLWRSGDLLIVAPRVLTTLCVLVERRGAVVGKTELLQTVWGDAHVEESNLTQTIFLLRRLLGKTSDGREYVQTVVRRGYRFAEDVTVVTAEGLQGNLPPLTVNTVDKESSGSVTPLTITSTPLVAAQVSAEPHRPGFHLSLLAGGVLVLLISVLTVRTLPSISLARRHGYAVLHYSRLTNDGYNKRLSSQLAQAGDCLFFTELVEGRSELSQVCKDGVVKRQALTEARDAVFSANGNDLLLGNNWDQEVSAPVLIASLAGEERSLGGLTAHGAAWAPDGKRIAITRGRQVLLADRQGAILRQLAQIDGVPFWPRWSPDGQRIRFSVNDGGRARGIFEVTLQGDASPVPVFTSEPFQSGACCGEWSPDGARFVFVLGTSQASSLWARSEQAPNGAGGAMPQVLADGPLDSWRAPIVAKDGQHIFAIGEHLRGELVRYDPSSSELRPWLHAVSADTANVSPDGHSVAYTAFPEGTLWRSSLDGHQPKQLTSEGQVARFPEWSPDGKWISFIAARPGAAWQVYVIPADGGSAEAIYPSPNSQGVATWSSDGRYLVFGSVASFGVSATDSAKLNVFDRETRTMQAIAGSNGLWMPRWSPDGRYIAATTLSRQDLWLYDVARATWDRVSHVSLNDLCWARHAPNMLLLDSPNGGHPAIFRMNVVTKESRKIVDLTDVQRTGFDGWRLSVDQQDSPVILRQAGTEEVYSLLVGARE